MRSKTAIYLENIFESGCACLMTMVQGNLFALTLAHWFTASQTGLIAGTVASTAIIATHIRRPWLVSLILGVITAGADFVAHPGTFGILGITEAVVTGSGASMLSLTVHGIGRRLVGRRSSRFARPSARAARASATVAAIEAGPSKCVRR